MKKCDLCRKPNSLHYRVKSTTRNRCFFAVKNVGILYQNKENILMETQESQNNKIIQLTHLPKSDVNFLKNLIIKLVLLTIIFE